jgi:hypothetical protein
VRRRSARLLAALLASFVVFGIGGAPASSSPAPGELRIAEEDSWHADRNFEFEWQPLAPPGPATEAVYRLYDSGGKAVRALTRPLGDLLDPFWVPPTPGIYTLEAWLQDAAGAQGPHSTATLRFDDTVPAGPALQGPPGWVLGVDAAAVEIGTSASSPLSGIRGYAVSVDRGGGSSPCASPTRCIGEEIDLVGSEGGTISLGTLPEGISSVRAVAVSGAGVSSPVATAEVQVDGTPPLLSLQGAPDGWSDGPAKVTALATDPLAGMAPAGPLGPFTAIAVDGSPPARAFGGAVTTWVTGNGIHRVEFFARDAAGNVADPGMQSTTATVRIDEDPPAVAFSPVQDPAEPERLEALVGDTLSGPNPDRGWIGVHPAGTAARFEQLPTRVAGDRLIARWDSDSYPPGKYEFLATGFDAAGNAAASTSRTTGSKMVLANPLKSQVEVKARLSRLRFVGRLRRSSGGVVAGREIAVTETFAAGAETQWRTTVAHTHPDGTFSVRLAPGPSRDVIATFAGDRTLTRTSSEGVRLEVPASVRLRASAASAQVGGAPVVFSGKVAAMGTKAAALKGLPVELQFRYRGGSWSEFRTVEVSRRGRFRYAYRFSDDDSRGVRFQFRAYVKGREGWPYGPGTSRPVIVTGR